MRVVESSQPHCTVESETAGADSDRHGDASPVERDGLVDELSVSVTILSEPIQELVVEATIAVPDVPEMNAILCCEIHWIAGI